MNMELPYYKWYNEVWPTLYNKDPHEHLLKGTINIVKRDSIKSRKSNLSNAFSNNSIKQVLNRRISVRSRGSANQFNRQESSEQSIGKGGAPGNQAFFPAPLQQFMAESCDNETMIERMDDEMMDKESYHSGSLGKEKMNQNQHYMDLLSAQNRRQTL